jgi:hypothetical protein
MRTVRTTASRPTRLAGGVRSAQTLGPHGHSAGHAQGSRSKGPTASRTPVPLVHCRPLLARSQRRSAPASRAGENVSQSHGSSPADPSAQAQAIRPACPPASSGGAFACQAHGTGPLTRSHIAFQRNHGAPHSRRGRCVGGSSLGSAFGTRPWEPNPSLEGTSTGKAPWPRGAQEYHAPRGQGASPLPAPQLKR